MERDKEKIQSVGYGVTIKALPTSPFLGPGQGVNVCRKARATGLQTVALAFFLHSRTQQSGSANAERTQPTGNL